MLINWFTVGAQALNFLVLIWLMKRFLYKPILHAIDEREKRIAAELADAEKKKAEARKEGDAFSARNAEFDRQHDALISKAADEAQAERERLLDEARNAASKLSLKRQETMRNEQRSLHQALSSRTQQEVFAIARKALTDLAAVSLEERMGAVFTRRLQEMDDQSKESLSRSFAAADPVLVRSAFDLPAEQRTAIQHALNKTFSAEIRIQFETAPDLISGIELTTNGQKVAWSIADYLVSMEKSINELLQEKEKSMAQAGISADLTSQITMRAFELYEERGSKNDSASRDWSQAEQEIRNTELKTAPEPEAKTKPEPEAKTKPEPEEPNPETKSK